MSQQVYVAIPNDNNWINLVVLLNENDAKNYSLNNSNIIVRLFVQFQNYGYHPTSKYYLNGVAYLPQ